MTELSSLEIRIQSNDVATAERRLQTLASSGSTAERATAALTNTFSRFSAPTGTAATALQNINQQLSRIRGSGASAASSTSSVSSSLTSVNSSAHAAAYVHQSSNLALMVSAVSPDWLPEKAEVCHRFLHIPFHLLYG